MATVVSTDKMALSTQGRCRVVECVELGSDGYDEEPVSVLRAAAAIGNALGASFGDRHR